MQSTDVLIQLIPTLFLSCILGALMAWVASKLGRSKLLWFVLGAIPGVNLVFLWVAVWMSIINLSRRLKAIEDL